MTIRLSWRWPFWLYTIETGVCLMAVVLFGEETFYDRQLPASMQPPRNSRFQRLIGVEQWRSRRLRNSFAQAMMRAIRTVSKPVVLMADLYYACTFAWVVAINATLALFVTPLYNFGPKQIGNIPLPAPSSLIEHPPLHNSTSAALTPFPFQASSSSPPSSRPSSQRSSATGYTT